MRVLTFIAVLCYNLNTLFKGACVLDCLNIAEDMDVLKKVSEDNLVAAFAMSDVVEEDHSSFMVIQTYDAPQTQHKMVTFVSITDPDWEEQLDLNDINVSNKAEMFFEVGGLYQFYKDEKEKTVSICESYYNKTIQQRFENVYDYITFYLELENHKRCEQDEINITSAVIQGAYCLCQVCDEMKFKDSPMCENGKTEAKNIVDKSIEQLKQIMFREEHGPTYFYDLSIKVLDCLENVNNYYHGEDEKFVDASSVDEKSPTM